MTCMQSMRKRADIMWFSIPSLHSKSDASTEKKRPKKQSLTFDEEEPSAPTTKKQTCAQMIKDMEAVMDVLMEKHGSKIIFGWTTECLGSYDTNGKACINRSPTCIAILWQRSEAFKGKQDGTQPSSHISVALSPGNHISLRSAVRHRGGWSMEGAWLLHVWPWGWTLSQPIHSMQGDCRLPWWCNPGVPFPTSSGWWTWRFL